MIILGHVYLHHLVVWRLGWMYDKWMQIEMIKTNRITGETIETVRVQSAVGQEVAAELLLLSHWSGHTIVEDSTKQVLILYHQKSCTNLKGHTIAIVTTSNNRTILFQTSTSVPVTPSWSTSNNQPIRSQYRHCRLQCKQVPTEHAKQYCSNLVRPIRPHHCHYGAW